MQQFPLRVDLDLRLRLYGLPQGYDRSDPATEEEVTDSLCSRHCTGLDLEAWVPDETTPCKFRHLREAQELGTRILELIQPHRAEQCFRLRQGTVLYAALIDAHTFAPDSKGQLDKGISWAGIGSGVRIGGSAPCVTGPGMSGATVAVSLR